MKSPPIALCLESDPPCAILATRRKTDFILKHPVPHNTLAPSLDQLPLS
jgi:hypothetical protein